jgi:tRNA(Ile)-lysidine synthase
VRRSLQAHAALKPGDGLVACVSGGVDSVALLLALASLAPALQLRLHVLHFNHALRAESEGEAALVASLAARLGLPLTTLTATPGAWRAAGLPAQARAWRRREALALAASLRAQCGGGVKVALGHQADDSRETLLLKLLRGAHLSRLAGLAPRRGVFVRPLLGCSKAQLQAYVTASGSEWAEDASNADPAKGRRNAVRLQLVPLLQQLSGGGLDARLRDATEQSALLRDALRAAPCTWAPRDADAADADVDADAAAEGEGEDEEEEEAEEDGDSLADAGWLAGGEPPAAALRRGELDLAAWRCLPPLARMDQLHGFVRDATRAPLSYSTLRELAARAAAPGSRQRWSAHAGAGWALERAGGRLRMLRLGTGRGGIPPAAAARTQLAPDDGGPPVIVTHPAGWRVSLAEGAGRDALPLRGLPSDVPLALQLRRRRDGDALALGSTRAHVKVTRLLRDGGVPLHERDAHPVAEHGERLLALWPRWPAVPGGGGRNIWLRVEGWRDSPVPEAE